MSQSASSRFRRPSACPRCAQALALKLRDAVQVYGCEACHGIWVDRVREQDLVRVKPKAFTVDELIRLRQFYLPRARLEEVRYVTCPVCQELMQRLNWGSHSGVVVDRCKGHGTWYDAGEVEKIREFVTLGGAEWEKYRFAEREIGQLAAKLDREMHKMDMRVLSAYTRARLMSSVVGA